MNALCYKIVFSKRLGTLVAVGEHTAGQGKAAGTGVRTVVFPSSSAASADNFVGLLKSVFASVALSFVTVGYATAAGPAVNTLPTGYSVNSGNVAISSTSSATNAAMTIKQTTDKASVNWNSFSIGSGAAVNVEQNNANSVLLNRVVGNDPSQIFGKLTANGQVILINPNGVVFGKGGSVTASAFTASTFGMTDADFNNGKHKFTRNGSTAGVTVEEGARIDTTGYVALMGASVDNQGAITTQGGAVVLAAGDSVALPSAMTDNISVPLSGKVRLELLPSTLNAMVANSGTITTEGGQVLMQAAALSDAVASITHTGTIDTTGEQGGAVTLLADNGNIKVSGSITANSSSASYKGGNIMIGRDEVTGVLAKVTNVSGAKLESKGGFVETSGHDLVFANTVVKAKDWLLDPTDLTVDGTNVGAIETSLNLDTSVTLTTRLIGQPDDTGTQDGNITINADITKTTGTEATLKLIANNGITVNNKISSTTGGKLNVEMTALGATSTATNSKGIVLNKMIDANGGKVILAGTTSNANSSGVIFSGVSGINAESFVVNGNNTSTAGSSWPPTSNGVMLKDTNTKNFTSTGFSSIIGNTQNSNGIGVFINNNSSAGMVVNMNAGPGAINVESHALSKTGVRVGFNPGLTVNTQGNVTLGSQNSNTSDLIIQAAINASSGTIRFLGKSSAGIAVDFREGIGSSPIVNATGTAKIVMNGISNSGVGVQMGTGRAKTIITSQYGSIDITGTSGTSQGINVQQGSAIESIIPTSGTGSAGAVTLTGKSTSGNAITVVNNTSVIKGSSVTLRGTSNTGGGVNGTGTITATSGNVQIDGLTTAGNTGGWVATTNKITASNGDIEINGTSKAGIKAGVAIGVGADVEGKNVKISGSSTGTTGVDVAALIKATDDATNAEGVTLTGFGGNTYGQYNQGVWVRTTGSVDSKSKVSIVGTNDLAGGMPTLMGTQIEGKVTAVHNINLEGHSNSTSSQNNGLVIQNIVESKTGTITAIATSVNQVNTALLIKGAGQLVTSNKEINLTANSMSFGGATASTAINAGTANVNIRTKDDGKKIQLGKSDTTSGEPELRLDQTEFSKITAGHLLIGHAQAGNIIVGGPITTATTTDLSLLTGGNIAVNEVLTVGGPSATNNLSLNGLGNGPTSSFISQTAAIKAAGLELLGANATHTLINTGNQVGTIAANTKQVTYTNNGDLAVGTVNSTTGVTTQTGANITTQTGNLSLNESISNTASGNVVVGAGVSKGVGDTTGGDIRTTDGKGVTHTGGKLVVYSGSSSGAGLLSYLDSALGNLQVTGTATQNVDTNVTYNAGVGISGSTENAQMMFREKVTITNGLVGTTVGKTYGDVNTKNTLADKLGLLADAKTKMKGEVGNSGTVNGVYDATSTNTIHIAKSVIIDSLNGNLDGDVIASYSNASYLKANGTYAYNTIAKPLTSSKYTIDGIVGDVKVTVAQKALTGTIGAVTKTYGDALAFGAVGALSGKLTDDTVSAGTSQIVLDSTNTSTSGKLIAGTHTQTLSGISGADAANYSFTGVTGSYTVNKLALTGASIGAASNIYGGTVGSGAVSLTGTNKIGSDDLGTGTAAVVSTTADLSSSGNLKANTYNQKVTGLSGSDADNYDFTGVTSTGNYTVNKLALTGASIGAASNIYGGTVGSGAVSLTGTNKIGSDDLDTGTAAVVSNSITDFSSSGNLKANTYNQKVTGLSGTDAGNYDFTGVISTGNYKVNKLALTGASIGAASNIYGSTVGAGTVSLTGTNKIGSDVLGTGTAAVVSNSITDFSSSGNLKANTYNQKVTGLSGTDAGNYDFTGVTSTGNYTVSKKTIIVSGLSVNNKTYDGTKVASVTDGSSLSTVAVGSSLANDNSVVAGDNVSLTGTAVGIYDSKDVAATGNKVTFTGKALSKTNEAGANDTSNYSMVQQAQTTGDGTITKANLNVALAAQNKTYDGSTAAALAEGAITVTGVTVGGVAETATVSKASGIFNDKNVATATSVTTSLAATDFTSGTADLSNYNLPTTVTGSGTITPKSLTALYAANNKVFDGNTNAVVTATLKDIIAGDTVTATNTSATFNSSDVGTNKTVTVAGIALSGKDAANYAVSNPDKKATTQANITAVPPAPVLPVVPSSTSARVKIPLGSANPFTLASAEELADETCTANSIENCFCEESLANLEVDICYEPTSHKQVKR